MYQRQEPVSYDFRRASKLSQGHVRSFLRVSEKVSRQLGNQLTAKLDKFITGSPGKIRQVSYEELSQQVSPLAVVMTSQFPPLKGEFQLIISNQIIHGCTELLLGGQEMPTEEKILTDIDKILVRQLAEEWLPLYGEAFSSLVPLSTKLERLELAQDFSFPLPLHDRVMVIETVIHMGTAKGSIELVIPATVFEELIPYLSLSEGAVRLEDETAIHTRQLLETGIFETDLTIQALLGECTLDVKDLLSLQTGDVLRLSTSIDELVPIYIDQKLVYKGQIGLHRGKRAVQIVEQEASQ